MEGRLDRSVAPGDEHRRLRVLLLDDEDVIHWGFRMLLSGESWVERFHATHTSSRAVELAQRFDPHVALIDLMLGNESGADACEKVLAASPTTRFLLMSAMDRMSARSAQALGASGFVPKSWKGRDLAGAVRMVGLGMTVFANSEVTGQTLLTAREHEVLEMIAGGATNREIAARLFLSPHTVKDHTSTLYRKMNARNRAEAILRAQRMGLLA